MADIQVFIDRAKLTDTNPAIIGSFPEMPLVDRNNYGSQFTVLTVPTTATMLQDPFRILVLKADWRNTPDSIVNWEAYRRIMEAFTEFMQRNANSALTQMTIQYGTNIASWPQDAKDTKAESDRGWAYVTQVRTTADALITSMPIDPTSDTNWPTKISPIYIPNW